jgi:hypothetical protein
MPEKETVEIKGIEIFATGVWHGDKYRTDDLDAMVSSFNDKGFGAPVKLGHNSEQEKDGQPSFGWVGRVFREGNKLLADLTDVPKKLGEAIQRKQFRQVSSEVIWNFKDGMPRVLRAIALLGADIPEVKGLAPLDRAEIAFGDGVDCRIYSLNKHDIKLQEAMDKTIEEIQKQKQIDTEEKLMSEELKKKIEDLEGKLEAKDKATNELEGKVKEFSDEAETVRAKLDEERVKAKTEKIDTFCDGLTKEGKLAPALESQLKAVLLSADSEKVIKFSVDNKEQESTQLDSLLAIFSESQKLVDFSEAGKQDEKKVNFDESADPEVELDRLVKEFMDDAEAKGVELDYSGAVDKVYKAHPEIKTAIEDK